MYEGVNLTRISLNFDEFVLSLCAYETNSSYLVAPPSPFLQLILSLLSVYRYLPEQGLQEENLSFHFCELCIQAL